MCIGIPLIRNLPYPLPCLCYACRWVWTFTINLCNMYRIWNKMSLFLGLGLPDSVLSHTTFLPVFSNVFSLLSSLSAFYFPISYLSGFPFEVLDSFQESSSGRNPKERKVFRLKTASFVLKCDQSSNSFGDPCSISYITR